MSPYPIDPIMVRMPAVSSEQSGDAMIAAAAELFGDSDDGARQRFLALPAAQFLALGRPVLTERLAGPALRDAKRVDNSATQARRILVPTSQ